MEHSGVHKTRCHCIALRRASGAVTEYYDRAMAQAGLSVSQYSILVNLFRMEEATTSELAKKLGLDRTTLTRNLKPLIKNGLVTDMANPGTRNRRLQVSSAGESILEKARCAWEAAQKGVESALGPENTALLMELLCRLQEL